MRRLRLLPRADADLNEALSYLATEAGVDVARRFLAAVQEAFAFVCENPAAGSPGQYLSDKLQGVRRWPVPHFTNYLLFYRFTDDNVDVVRLLHGARDIELVFDTEE